MMQQLRAFTERVNASASRVAGSVSGELDAALAYFGMTATTGTTVVFNDTAWNAMPSVHATAICTHGKRYERRPQEMLT